MANPAFGRQVPWASTSTCRHCEREIRREGQEWRHKGSGSVWCVPGKSQTVAEPTAEQLRLDE